MASKPHYSNVCGRCDCAALPSAFDGTATTPPNPQKEAKDALQANANWLDWVERFAQGTVVAITALRNHLWDWFTSSWAYHETAPEIGEMMVQLAVIGSGVFLLTLQIHGIQQLVMSVHDQDTIRSSDLNGLSMKIGAISGISIAISLGLLESTVAGDAASDGAAAAVDFGLTMLGFIGVGTNIAVFVPTMIAINWAQIDIGGCEHPNAGMC